MIFHGRVPEAMGVWGLRFRLNPLRWRRTRRKSKTLRRKTMAKTKPTPRRMRRRNPLRASARGSGRTVIITTTPDDITADTADITTAGITASNLRNYVMPWFNLGSGSRRQAAGLLRQE